MFDVRYGCSLDVVAKKLKIRYDFKRMYELEKDREIERERERFAKLYKGLKEFTNKPIQVRTKKEAKKRERKNVASEKGEKVLKISSNKLSWNKK
jgi:hypothetical protein